MKSLDKQEKYRQLYKRSKPGYRTSGQVYEGLIAGHIAAELSSLRENFGLDHLVAGDLKAMPFADGSFDLVISSWVIEHLEAPDAAFAEIARVLRQGGHFVF